MPADQEAVRVRVIRQNRLDARRRGVPVLSVVENRQPLAVVVRPHALQALQHLVTFDGQPVVSGGIGKDRAPNRVRMQHRPRAARARDRQVQTRLGRGRARPAHDLAVLVDLHDLARREDALIHAAGRNREAHWVAAHDGAEVAARPERPAARVAVASDLGELSGKLGERRGATRVHSGGYDRASLRARPGAPLSPPRL